MTPIAIAVLIAAAPVPAKSAEQARIESLFGTTFDADKCGKFSLSGDTLTVGLSKSFRENAKETYQPFGKGARTEWKVTLPCEVSVRLAIPKPPDLDIDAKREQSWWAGLIVREKDDRFVEFGNTARTSADQQRTYVTRGVQFADIAGFTPSFNYSTGNQLHLNSDDPVWLKLSLTRDSVKSFVSLDGKEWLPSMFGQDTDLPETVTVGVSVWQQCKLDVAAEFSRFTVAKPK